MSSFRTVGFWTKFIVLTLIAYALVSLFNLKQSIDDKRAQVLALAQNVEAQIQCNDELTDAIENRNDAEHRKDIARQQLGLLEPSEKIFYIID